MIAVNCKTEVEKWGVFEISLPGPQAGNPFTEQHCCGKFIGKNEVVETDGFYDGVGIYKFRFMPSFEGEYSFVLSGSFLEGEVAGNFIVKPASTENHGPVRVNGFHFAYEDGTPYFSVGTTCYVWTHQPEAIQKKTLEELAKGYFNKIRFCVFPKHYIHNFNEPISYPYEGTPCEINKDISTEYSELMKIQPGNKWDFERFNPKHFSHFENCIEKLCQLGIEADIIVMHPYDRWGFSQMSKEQDDLYWRYVIARFSAYRNVWWSLANEYDIFPKKTLEDWERYASILCEKDKYNHLRSIHNCIPFYDYARPWITHCSIQRQDVYKCAELTDEYRERYQKPVVLDEIAYEGNIDQGWGNISGKELVRRFWEATVRGGYAGHGETYIHPQDVLWWSHGGELHGDSPTRIKFLHDEVLAKIPGYGLKRVQRNWDESAATVEGMNAGNYYLIYYGFMRPSFRTLYFDDISSYQVELIDTWDMTIQDLGVFSGKFDVKMPGKEYMTLRITKV
ncbi:DUF5605 domain-containing protein [Scatolibacter rhodanostii]|uniref:DUF5605 domain-containing protein n=1 Tax=Scatolibacter rhodanostii TaxID=2014781 RepID=UPI000C069A9B|nr:DUF5605 domain-containing protein [Scatolibacter rhodanostii]